jgi:hypothetical protein
MTVTNTKKATSTRKAVSPRKATKLQQATSPKQSTKLQQATSPKQSTKLQQATSPKQSTKLQQATSPKQSTKLQKPIEAARRAKARRELGSLDYIRSVRVAVEELGQAAVARALSVTQPAVSKLLAGAEARGVKSVPDGFSGAGPYEIAERYAAGDIDRDAMIHELSAWPYARNEGTAAAAEEWESTPYLDTPGSFAEVGRAFDEGLIDGDAYDLILDTAEDVTEHLG